MKIFKLLLSKTFLFHVLYVLFAAASVYGYAEFAPDPLVAEFVKSPLFVAAVQGIIAIILRWVTKVPLEEKKSLFD